MRTSVEIISCQIILYSQDSRSFVTQTWQSRKPIEQIILLTIFVDLDTFFVDFDTLA